MRKITILTTLAFVIALCALPALGDQLTLTGPSTTPLYFCSVSGGDIYVSAAAFGNTTTCSSNSSGTMSGGGVLKSGNGTTLDSGGTYDFGFPGGSSTLVLIPVSLPSPPNNMWNPSNGTPATFTYSDNLGSFNGAITWGQVGDTTLPTTFQGNILIAATGYTATGALAQDFPIGGQVRFDFTMDLPLGTLASLSTTPGTASGPLSSGQVPGVPEVSSILLLGTGLLSAGTFVRLRRRRQS